MKTIKNTTNELLFKIIVIGESSTGKSCLMVRYIKDDFNSEYSVTIGVQFASKIVKIDQSYAIKLQIWDTAGQESFRSIVRNFYRNSSAVFLVYNILKKSTFQALGSWLKEARENSGKNVMYVLVGTHLDCVQSGEAERNVSKSQAERFMKQENLDLFFETSAKKNINVSQAFEQTGHQLFLNYIKLRTSTGLKTISAETTENNKSKGLTNQQQQKKKCCNI